MPKRVMVIGVLFVLGGVMAIWSIIEAAMNSRIYLNFGLFLLPVGIGLLRGRASSQWWARFWMIVQTHQQPVECHLPPHALEIHSLGFGRGVQPVFQCPAE